MNLLLDTHTFIWWDSQPNRLSPQVLELCRDRSNTLILSIVSIWEMQIKSQLGKLQLDSSLHELVMKQQRTNDIQICNARLEHVLELEKLPLHHRDPFDRLLIAQARVENAIFLSRDTAFSAYSVQVVW